MTAEAPVCNLQPKAPRALQLAASLRVRRARNRRILPSFLRKEPQTVLARARL